MTVRLTRPQVNEIARIRTQGERGIPASEVNKSTAALERAGYVMRKPVPGSADHRYVLTPKGAAF